MKRIFIILFFLPLLFFTQNNIVDSLKLALKNARHDTTRCNILSQLAESAGDNEWPAFNEQLKIIAEKNITGTNAAKKIYLKHLATAYNNIAYLAEHQGNILRALEYDNKALKIQEETRDRQGISVSLNNLALIYQKKGDIPNALEYYNKSLKILEEIGNIEQIAYSLSGLGRIYQDQGDIPKALEYFSKCLKIQENLGNKKGIALALNNFGVVSSIQNDWPKTLEYHLRSLKILEEIDDKQGIAYSLSNIGFCYQKQGDILKALFYFETSLKIREGIEDKQGLANSLNDIGVIYHKMGETKKALVYYYKSLQIREAIGEKRGIANSLGNIARLKTDNGQVLEALKFADRGMQIAKEMGYPENIRDLARILRIIYQKQKKYKGAFEMLELETAMRDSITNQENKKANIKTQIKYEYEKKAAADSVKVAEEKKVTQAQLKQEQTQRYALYGGLGLVGIFAIFMVNRFRITNKQKKVIEEQKKIVEEQKHVVDEKQKEILDSIHYAKRIQTALITNEKYISKNLKKLSRN